MAARFVLFCAISSIVMQTSSVRPDGINLPSPPIDCISSPTDQRTLSNLLSSNVCTEVPTSYIPSGARLTESITSTTSQETCVRQEIPQSIDLSSASKLPFQTVSLSAPLIDQPFNPSIAIAPQISEIPPINLSNLESCAFVKNNLVSNDCTQKVIPPTAQKISGYFVTNKDNFCGSTNCLTLKLDNLPNNICKVKVGDSKPIFIDCSKQTNSYKSPVALTPVNPIEIHNLGKPHTPSLQVTPNLLVDNSNQLKDVIPPPAPIKISEENPAVPPRPSNMLTNEPAVEQTTDAEKSPSTGKVLYPIKNIKFSYGANAFNPFKNACNEKTQSITPPKLLPMDNNIGLVVSPVVNIVDNGKSTQCDIQSPDNGYCKCINVNTLPNPELTSYYSKSPQSSPSCMVNSVYFPETPKPIPVSQLPIVNTINTIMPTQSSTLLNPIRETAHETFTSALSCSLNNIISLLTAGLLSKFFEKTSPETSIADLAPIETCDAIVFKEPILDMKPSVPNVKTPYASNLPLATCPPLIKSPPILPNPTMGVFRDSKISSALCTDNKNRKPYIASITINVMSNAEAANDIIILV